MHFDVTSSRSINDPPSIRITFANGVQDDLELTQYKFHESSEGGCNYLGHLRNDYASSAAVTGCLNQPGDLMDVTLISKNNINKMFSVDFFGNAEIIENPFKQGGNIAWIRNSDIPTKSKKLFESSFNAYLSMINTSNPYYSSNIESNIR